MYNQNYNTIGKNYHFNQAIKLGTSEYKSFNINNKLNENNTGVSLSNTLPHQRNNSNNKQNNINGNIYMNSTLNHNLPNKTLGPSISNSNKFLNHVNSNPVSNQQERVINFGQDSSENSFKRNLRKVGGLTPIQSSSYNIITGITYSNQNNGVNNMNFLTRNKIFDTTNPSFMLNKNVLTTSGYNLSSGSNSNANSSNSKNYNSPRNSQMTAINTLNKLNSSSGMESKDNTSHLNNRIENVGYSSNNHSKTMSDASSFVNQTPASPRPIIEQKNKDNSQNASASYPAVPTNIASMRFDETCYYVKDCSSVKEYAYKEDPNPGYRNHMEDMSKAIDKFAGDHDKGLFTIFDGHGGYEVATYAKHRAPELLEKMMKDNPNSTNPMENVLINLFNQIDEEIKFAEDEHVGSTATVVLITKEKDSTNHSKKVLYCANVGDSRCVLISSLGAKRISKDHKVSDPAETKRITSGGGIIFAGRVYGQLILSRALGDFSLKKHGVISTPYVSKHYITEKDKYIVLASDGVWDVISDEELFRLSLTIANSDEFVKKIVSNSLIRGTQDNVSCFVIKLN